MSVQGLYDILWLLEFFGTTRFPHVVWEDWLIPKEWNRFLDRANGSYANMTSV